MAIFIQELTPETPCVLNPEDNRTSLTIRPETPGVLDPEDNRTSSMFSWCQGAPDPALHGHGTNVPPAAVQAAGGLFDGGHLRVVSTGISIMEQEVAERQHRHHALCVLLNVLLQVLQGKQDSQFKPD